MNSKVVNAAFAAIEGKIVLPLNSGMCLKTVRIVVENGYKVPGGHLYKHITYRTVRNDYYAYDLERSLAAKGWSVTLANRKPGDILFARVSMPYGHTGVLLPNDLVLENTWAKRGRVVRGAIKVTPLAQWDKVSTVIRIPAVI